ncbi:rhodanese-like domain-containing protein [Seonamhaeicola maritimus]|uniref:Rhodanese-like domain-containing protein n=1 Tax=Seonamhaeicola maritimus TaxID=2591822 RepID=A0A5C7GKQ4_9FLAO|nr:rhodanese-like domain-containing protein [Seonamhaeicola maritimus]TXG38928.1 rhodanese-like domain-containing protein [Seonamhaeicola maritimus]
MKRFLILSFPVFTVFFLGCQETEKTEAVLLSAEEMKTMLEDKSLLLIDVRTPKEFAEGHIKNAINIDFYSETFKEDIKKLDPNVPVLLYCRSGGRSGKTAKMLQKTGFKKSFDLKGGILKWKEQGFEIIK